MFLGFDDSCEICVKEAMNSLTNLLPFIDEHFMD